MHKYLFNLDSALLKIELSSAFIAAIAVKIDGYITVVECLESNHARHVVLRVEVAAEIEAIITI
jgi:hypothetical protein